MTSKRPSIAGGSVGTAAAPATDASTADDSVRASSIRSCAVRRSKLLEDAKEALTGNVRPDNIFAHSARMKNERPDLALPKVFVQSISDVDDVGGGGGGGGWIVTVDDDDDENERSGERGGSETMVCRSPTSSQPIWLSPTRKSGVSGVSGLSAIPMNEEQRLERQRRQEKRREKETESLSNLVHDTAYRRIDHDDDDGDGVGNRDLGGEEGSCSLNREEAAAASEERADSSQRAAEVRRETRGGNRLLGISGGGGDHECANRVVGSPAEVRPLGGSGQIVNIARKSAVPEARATHLLPRETDLHARRIRWSPSVFLENFKSPAFTLSFRDNVARSMTEMIERYVDINFTSSELANQRRIQGNLNLKKMSDVFNEARNRTLASLAETETRYHELARKRRDMDVAYENLNTYVNQKDELVGNAQKIIANEGMQVEKRKIQVDEKREELRRFQQKVDAVRRQMRRLSPFVDYLNRVTQMEEHQTMFPNRLAIIHRVETLMIIRTEMIRLLEDQFREETVIREHFFKDREFVNTIHDRSNDAIRRLNMKLDRLERRCTRWSDLIAKREGEECGKKAMKGQCVRAIEYMYETVAKFKKTAMNPDLPLIEKLNQVSRFMEYRLGVEKEVERQEEEVKKKEERRKRRLLESARKQHTKKHAT